MKIEEQDIWIATSPLSEPVYVGEQVEYSDGMELRDFHSRSLGRTFESIHFIESITRVSQSVDAMHTAAIKQQPGSVMNIPKPAAIESPAEGEIKHLSDGKTVADIHAGSAQLNEQTVSLNAKVIKVSKNIVGKNWITLQDGTGTEPDNKLLATSQDLVEPGDTVIAKGVVRTDIDIGSGYKYKVLLEEVTFSPGVE
jgi:hypothetical protein